MTTAPSPIVRAYPTRNHTDQLGYWPDPFNQSSLLLPLPPHWKHSKPVNEQPKMSSTYFSTPNYKDTTKSVVGLADRLTHGAKELVVGKGGGALVGIAR